MADLKQILLTIRSGGLRHSLNILRYTLQKIQLERTRPASPQAITRLCPGRLLASQKILGGCTCTFENASLEIKFLTPDMLRVDWGPGTSPIPYALQRLDWSSPQIEYSPDGLRLSSAELHVLVQPDGGIQYFSASGSLLREDFPPLRSGAGWQQRTRLQPGEAQYGLGIQAGPFNLLARSHRLWAHDPGGHYTSGHDPLYMPVPVMLAIHDQGSYLIFHENSYDGIFAPQDTDDGKPGCQISFSGGRLRSYFIIGPPAAAMQRYTQLTGRAPLPPRWSLGYHQSRWGYKSDQDIRQVLAGFQRHNLPISAIHLDIDYMDHGRTFAFDPHTFPDVKALSADLSAAGVRLVTIVDPGVKIDRAYDVYTSGLQAGVFCQLPDGRPIAGMLWMGRSLYPDFTSPVARAWWGAFYPRLHELGISGFWHDMNEPTSFVAWGELTLPIVTRHHLEGQGGGHIQAHNLYGMQMNRAAHQALSQQLPNLRPWILSRSGWAGSQRYAWNWSADTGSTWECLRMNLASLLGLALSGFAYTGPDIGGFSGSPSAQLYLRWFQMAAFLPFFRTHSSVGTARREPWVYGEPYTGIIRAFLALRYSLLPYLYTLAWQHTRDGAPLIRPLFWDDWRDPALRGIDSAFFLGSTLLIAPVLEENATQLQITLPAGWWYNFWNDALLDAAAGQTFTLPVALEQIPVFVRAGSILPISDGDDLILHIYPPGPASPASQPAGQLYSDAGDGDGPSRLDQFTLHESAGRLEIGWSAQGEYPFPYRQLRVRIHTRAGSHYKHDPSADLTRIFQPGGQDLSFERL